MTSPVDPNNVMMTGENSFIRFSPRRRHCRRWPAAVFTNSGP